MQAPARPEEVAWYDFTSRPGHPGNAVVAGHRNWRDGTVAVFARLGMLTPGDAVEAIREDGERLYYMVVAVEDLDASTTEVSEVVNWAAPESSQLMPRRGL